MIPSPTGVGYLDLNDPANAAYRLSWSQGGQTQYYRPWINLGTLSMNGNDNTTRHNEGMVRIEKRYSKGLNFQVWYTYAKTLSRGSANEYLDWSLTKARTGNDQTHNLTGTMNYEIPVGKGRHFLNRSGWIDKTIGQWNFTWVYTIASGNMGGMGVSGQPTTYNFPGYMPTYGGVLDFQVPKLRSDWQDIGPDRFNQYDMKSMIGNCGPVVLTWGNSCFTYCPLVQPGHQRPQHVEYPADHRGVHVRSQGSVRLGAPAAPAPPGRPEPLQVVQLGRAQHHHQRAEPDQRLDLRNPGHFQRWGHDGLRRSAHVEHDSRPQMVESGG